MNLKRVRYEDLCVWKLKYARLEENRKRFVDF